MEFVSISKLSRFKDKIMGLLNQKAPLQSPSFTGSPTTPTPTQSTTGKVLVNQEYVANNATNKKYVDDADAVVKEVADSAKAIAEVALPKTGGTMTGSLVLSGKPTADNEAANKKYVDDEVAKCAPMYGYGTADLNAGVSALETGKLYFVYE